MKHATPSTGNGPLTGVFSAPQVFATQAVPDHCEPGYELVNGTWQKGAALLAAEQEATEDAAERATLKNAYALFKAGTATNAQIQRAIAYLLKKTA
jgi:hypothetical protein